MFVIKTCMDKRVGVPLSWKALSCENTYTTRAWSLRRDVSMAIDTGMSMYVPGIDELDCLVYVSDGDNSKDWPKYLPDSFVKSASGADSDMHLLAHQRVVPSNIFDHGRGYILLRDVDFSTDDDSTLGVVQKALDPLCVVLTDNAGERAGVLRTLRPKGMMAVAEPEERSSVGLTSIEL